MDNQSADMDTALESIQPPLNILTSLKPSPSRPDSEFLAAPCPSRPGSRKYFLQPNEWLSTAAPNDKQNDALSIILPSESEKVCEQLDSYLRQAVEDGKCSVQHPVEEGVYLPLWVIRLWKWGNVLAKKQALWKTHLKWVQETAVLEN